jgi:hypothetical protein
MSFEQDWFQMAPGMFARFEKLAVRLGEKIELIRDAKY